MELKCEYCKIPGTYGNLIYEPGYRQIYLAPSQRYFGTCVAVLKRHCKNLRELKIIEWIKFTEIVDKLETTLKKASIPRYLIGDVS